VRGVGRAVSAAILLLIAGTLNIIFGIAAASLGALGALLAIGGAYRPGRWASSPCA